MEAILDQGLRYTSGPQWLAEHVLQGRHVLAVAAPTARRPPSMLAWILEHAGLQPASWWAAWLLSASPPPGQRPALLAAS